MTALAFNTTALAINITIPDRNDRNGIIIGYQITMVSEIGELHQQNFTTSYLVRWNETELSDEQAMTKVIFSGLRPFFDYAIKVQAFTKMGLGPESIPIVEKTAETGISAFIYYICMNN